MPPLLISGVIHPFLMVVLLLGSDELPALDPRLTKVYVPCLAFWCLCINVKFPPPSNNTVMFISLVLYPLYFVKVLFCFLYTVSFLLLTVMTCICLIPPPSLPDFFQCVLISNVCGFADGFMKKTRGKKKKSVVFRDGWWLVWLVITIAFF